jgi:hypothetical protein
LVRRLERIEERVRELFKDADEVVDDEVVRQLPPQRFASPREPAKLTLTR